MHRRRARLGDPDGENFHREVSCATEGTAVSCQRLVSPLRPPDGTEVGPFELPLLWHPMLYHYGRNVTVPG